MVRHDVQQPTRPNGGHLRLLVQVNKRAAAQHFARHQPRLRAGAEPHRDRRTRLSWNRQRAGGETCAQADNVVHQTGAAPGAFGGMHDFQRRQCGRSLRRR